MESNQSLQLYQSCVLPLSLQRQMVGTFGLEPKFSVSKTDTLSIELCAPKNLVGHFGLEPKIKAS